MKRLGLLTIALALAFLAVIPVNAATFDASKFPAWVESDGVWATVVNGSFKDGVQYAPTDAQLRVLMHLVSLTPTSTGKTDYLFVILKDVAQQVDVVGKGNANGGTVTALVFGDRLLPTNVSAGKHAQQLDRGYYNAGIASGYLNLGAISLGFGTHFFMTTPYANPSLRPESIEDVYLKGKGYKYTFGTNKAQVDAYGNLKFVCAIVIGTLDEKAQTKVTEHGHPENWVIAK